MLHASLFPRMRDLFDVLREQYNFILIDAPPILPLSDMHIFEEVVDGIVMIVRAERYDKRYGHESS